MDDPIRTEIMKHRLVSVAEEMGARLQRAAFSPNIKERCDFSCAVFNASGSLVAQAAHIPVHLGAMPMTLSSVLSEMTLQPEDVVITNDPYKGGSHLPDITLIEPVFSTSPHLSSTQPLFYVVNRAHHADVGGKNPGSMGLVNCLADEGYVISPTLLYAEGAYNDSFIGEFLENVRNPEERLGDLRAQIASLARGKLRLNDILDEYTVTDLVSPIKPDRNPIRGKVKYQEFRKTEEIAKLEDTFPEWLEMANRSYKMMEDEGLSLRKVEVDVDNLFEWCKKKNIPLNGEARSEYASVLLKEMDK